MKTGWRLVAKLGTEAQLFPHILADSHGWALRLGSNVHADMKYFSSFPNVLAGLVEHWIRRRLGADRPIISLEDLAAEVQKEIAHARELCQIANREIDFLASMVHKKAS